MGGPKAVTPARAVRAVACNSAQFGRVDRIKDTLGILSNAHHRRRDNSTDPCVEHRTDRRARPTIILPDAKGRIISHHPRTGVRIERRGVTVSTQNAPARVVTFSNSNPIWVCVVARPHLDERAVAGWPRPEEVIALDEVEGRGADAGTIVHHLGKPQRID